MPGIIKLNRLMHEYKLDEKTCKIIIGNDNDIYNVIERMDNYLGSGFRNKIIDECACCTKSSKGRTKCSKEYGKSFQDKTLREKIDGIP